MSLILPPQEPETFLQKNKYYIIGGIIGAIVIVVVILWLVGVFDSKSSDNSPDNSPDVLSPLKGGPLQLVLNQNNLAGIENVEIGVYRNNLMTYSINWPIGTLRYKDVQSISDDVLFPNVTQLLDGTPAQIPALIPKAAGNYGPYITKSNIMINKTPNDYTPHVITESNSMINNPQEQLIKKYSFPAGSIFAFTVDNEFNITYLFHLSVEGVENYIEANGPDRSITSQTLRIKANP